MATPSSRKLRFTIPPEVLRRKTGPIAHYWTRGGQEWYAALASGAEAPFLACCMSDLKVRPTKLKPNSSDGSIFPCSQREFPPFEGRRGGRRGRITQRRRGHRGSRRVGQKGRVG